MSSSATKKERATLSKSKVSPSEIEDDTLVVAIRVRGWAKMRRDINDTLKLLRLNRVNAGVLLRVNPSYRGMLQKCKDYIAWGPVDDKILLRLFKKRAYITGNRHLTDKFLKDSNAGYSTVRKLVKAISSGEVSMRDIEGLKPLFRLHPPRGGHRGDGIKRAYNAGGTLGYVGEYINALLLKMM